MIIFISVYVLVDQNFNKYIYVYRFYKMRASPWPV